MAQLREGDRVGDWVVETRLGEGATAEVYRCRHAMSERMVAAVKLFFSDGPENRDKWFSREIEALATLNHPGIVRILHPGVDQERGMMFLAMELVEGETLLKHLSREVMPVAEVRRMFLRISDALAAAHARQIFHRDIKPSNILIREGGDPVILDFGIATTADPSLRTTSAVGTPTYMAPELLEDGPVDPARCDIYAVGVMLYEALTGTRAFPRSGEVRGDALVMHILQKKLTLEDLDPGPKVDPDLRAIVRACTARRPERRPASMADLAAQLRGESPAPRLPKPQSPRREMAAWVLGGLLSALLLSAAAGLVTWFVVMGM